MRAVLRLFRRSFRPEDLQRRRDPVARAERRRRACAASRATRSARARDRGTVDGVRVVSVLLAERPGARHRQVRIQAALAARAARMARRDSCVIRAGAAGRLQHHARRPRRTRPGGVGRLGSTVSPPEREALRAARGARLADAFRLFDQPAKTTPGGTSAWALPPERRPAHRPDAASPGAGAPACRLHHRPREPRLGAAIDHAPVLAAFDIA